MGEVHGYLTIIESCFPNHVLVWLSLFNTPWTGGKPLLYEGYKYLKIRDGK